MPRFPTSNIAHTAATDHRIPRRPDPHPRVADRPDAWLPGRVPLVSFHRGLPGPGEREVARDLGLALVEWAEPLPHGPERTALGRLALPRLEAAVAAAPDDVAAWQACGFAHWVLGQKTEALAAFEAALARAPERETALMYAASLTAVLGRGEAAAGYWRRALAVNPWAWRYHFELAKLQADHRDWALAARECQAALRLSPARRDARMLLVLCRLRSGQPDQARTEFDRVLAMNPSDPDGLRRWFLEQSR